MWSETLQDLVVGSKYATVEEAMKELKAKIDNIVSDLEIPQ